MRNTLLPILLLTACGGGSEAARVELPVVVDALGMTTVTNDLGWTITVGDTRVAVADLQFTIGGEVHDEKPPMIPRPHPGHSAGGDVTGELAGTFVLDFGQDGAPLGTGTLLAGSYQGGNLGLRVASELEASDPLSGHTAVLAGTAEKDGQTVEFLAQLDVDAGTQVIGLPFALDVTEGSVATIGVRLVSLHLYDGLDFGALDDDGDGQLAIQPGSPAHNLLRRTLQQHDHWRLEVR
jgi:hypothetical protein